MNRRGFSLVGAAVGLAAAGTGTAVAVRRRSRRVVVPPGPGPDLLGPLPGAERTVTTDDGVALQVWTRGEGGPAVLLVHGWCCDSRCWHHQWRALPGTLVAYDARCHGRSTIGRGGRDVIARLGRDLATILDEAVPPGPVALVGHSMGGMTILALADERPELFGDRIVAVALLGTSAGRLAEVTFGLPAALGGVMKRLLPWAVPRLGRRADLVDAGRTALPAEVMRLLMRTFGFRAHVPASSIALLSDMIAKTPFSVIADFYPAFAGHDKLAALRVLKPLPTLVAVGDHDLVTPPEHSRQIAETLPDGELVVVPECGHLVMLEHPARMNEALAAWLDRIP